MTSPKDKKKKTVLIFGGSGQLGNLIFNQYDQEKYTVINISARKKLEISGVINIQADITTKLGLLYSSFRLRSLIETIDVVVLASMFIYHKDLFSLTKKELTHEFDVNVFSQIECIKMIMNIFWKTEEGEVRTFLYISSAASLGLTTRKDLESYTLEKQSFNGVAHYFEPFLSKRNINTLLYLPGSLSEGSVRDALYNAFWIDILDKTKNGIKKRVF